ncbi:NOL1/NOP2/Sun family protein [Tieghemostelium lacteum]|uniref:NOL1/NOP2/Sun family protein n=1 Tax=Tieghemostelium lacteum TaxID=361077 RepID=A0A151ZJS2_TIELA|nr:NOL1/NOP2/Sun family protein [Tieghemostelium lacteum]|eukprot:KYQ94248.1 NOL1/NOP2/Sun family protein [Tieghemostelium lacteum]
MGGKRKTKSFKKKPDVWDPTKSKKYKNGVGQAVDVSSNPSNVGFTEWVLESEIFNNYYRPIGICKDEEEFQEMLKVMRKPLPTTFRINTSLGPIKDVVMQQLNELISDVSQIDQSILQATDPEEQKKLNEEEFEMAKPIPWYPNEMAWKTSIPRRLFRKVPSLQKFKSFLINHNEQGYITRQEAVSMIPPLFLDVESHHNVLDLCAAPGSKTTQIIEELHLKETSRNSNHYSVPTGCVLANDVDAKRCYLLVHNTRRLGSIAVGITNHEAQNYPIPFVTNENGERAPQFFDRILADVPCTGDGTARKNPDIWKAWKESSGQSLHILQVKIATRACHLLKVGGRMVYSTCSINPVENENVIAEVLLKSQGSMRLVDVSSQYPQLIRKPGLKTFPNCPYTEEQYNELHLERVMRVHPHFQDTGGFFIAVLEKVSDLPNQLAKRIEKPESKNTPPTTTTTTTTTTSTQEQKPTENTTIVNSETSTTATTDKKEPLYHNERKLNENDRRLGGNEEPFNLLGEEIKKEVGYAKEFYGLSDSFPYDQLLCRSEKSKKIYLVSKSLLKMIENDQESRKIKLINAGIKIFQKHEGNASPCSFRIAQESVAIIEPYCTKRIVHISHDELVMFLQQEPLFHQLPQSTQSQLAPIEQGCIIFKIDSEKPSLSKGMVFAGWRGKSSAHLLVSLQEIAALKGIFKIPTQEKKPNTTTTTTTTTTPSTNDEMKTDETPKTSE